MFMLNTSLSIRCFFASSAAVLNRGSEDDISRKFQILFKNMRMHLVIQAEIFIFVELTIINLTMLWHL